MYPGESSPTEVHSRFVDAENDSCYRCTANRTSAQHSERTGRRIARRHYDQGGLARLPRITFHFLMDWN